MSVGQKRKSEQRDLNPRPTAPKAAALAKLRYAPIMDREYIENYDFSKRIIIHKVRRCAHKEIRVNNLW